MQGISLTAVTETVIKRFTIDSTDINDPRQKFSLSQGETIGINWFRSTPQNHWEFELKTPYGGYYNWYAYKPHVMILGGNPLTQTGNLSTQIGAFLDTIAWAEGTDKNIGDGVKTGYNIIYSFQTFSSYTEHPHRIVCANGICSSAAGRYQFLDTTWDMLANMLNLSDFSPDNQDRGAIELIKRRGALLDIEQGRIRVACNKVSWEWASIPPGRYGQPIISYAKAEELFARAGGSLSY